MFEVLFICSYNHNDVLNTQIFIHKITIIPYSSLYVYINIYFTYVHKFSVHFLLTSSFFFLFTLFHNNLPRIFLLKRIYKINVHLYKLLLSMYILSKHMNYEKSFEIQRRHHIFSSMYICVERLYKYFIDVETFFVFSSHFFLLFFVRYLLLNRTLLFRTWIQI